MENFLNSFTRIQGLFSIYMGKPVAILYLTVWANGKKDSEVVNSFRNCVYHLHKPVPFLKKCPRKPKTGIKDGFFRCSVSPGNFPLERHEKHYQFTFQPEFPETFCVWENKQVVKAK